MKTEFFSIRLAPVVFDMWRSDGNFRAELIRAVAAKVRVKGGFSFQIVSVFGEVLYYGTVGRP